ncbi:MAG: efflux RND transporter periplasmic adaptor subunit [Rhodobacteraceae bacterium]|nr:efflux RND transporter periplasmic adaptor subunit [Paracoccaceae bacterium]
MKDTTNERRPETLDFSSDKGAARSTWIAAAIVLVLVAWMGSGFVLPSEPADAPAERAVLQPVTVAVARSVAQPVTQFFLAEGQALPDRDTAVRAEISGQISEVLVEKGADVEEGDVIARFDPVQRQADLERATAEVDRTKREFDNAQTLLERGTATVDRVATARASFAAAQAQLAAATEALDNAVLTVPFDGRLETLTINEGEFVQPGTEVARIVDNTPLTVAIQVPQQSLARIEVGQMAQVEFITGDVLPGLVTFVGTNADAATRTFLAEVAVDNANGKVPAGISAQERIPTGDVSAHFLSPAILSLGTDGTLGIKTVVEDDKVAFTPVEIVRAQTDGIWVTGLTDEARVITVGQGYVNDGETVAPQTATAEVTQ